MLKTKLQKKYRKLSQAYMYRKKSGYQACFWHLGSPNFGDDLNPYLLESVLGRPVYRDAKQQSLHLLGVGSILERANQNSIVVGSGFIRPDSELSREPHSVLAVRGELTQQRLGKTGLLLGDPGILVPHLLGVKSTNQEDVVLVPHVDSYSGIQAEFAHKYKVVDPSKEFSQVISNIAKAKYVLSQSLHGLVMADALSIPSVWIQPSEKMIGGEYKFQDYFTSTLEAKNSYTLNEALENKLYEDIAVISQPKISVAEYLSEYSGLIKEILHTN
jgi:pyruvyltransferase